MRVLRSLVLVAAAALLLCALLMWRLPVAAAAQVDPTSVAATPVPAPATAAAATFLAPPQNPVGVPVGREPVGGSLRAQGRLVRERDGQLYEDFPDGRRVLHTTVRMRDARGREWDEPVEIEATPVDPRRRDEPRAR